MEKTKVCVWLEPDLYEYLDTARGEELKIPQFIRLILKQKMKSSTKRKLTVTNMNDPFSGSCITADLIPDDLKDYSELLIEWWPIRKQKGGSCTTSVAERIFKTLRSFPSQDRKEALEKAISNGWKDIFPLKKGYKPEEPKNNHPAARVFTARGGFEL